MPTSDPAASGRPITAEDLFALRLVSDPQPSPDGQHVAYVLTRLDEEADDYKSAIWLVPTAGGDPVQLTSGTARDTTPRWSPDGTRIAFVSNRAGEWAKGVRKAEANESAEKPKGKKRQEKKDEKPKGQVWTIRVGGGEAQQLTRQEHGASAPVWSPDGGTIAFLSATEPEGEPDVAVPVPKPVADERIVTRVRYRYDGRGWIERYEHVWTIPADGGEATQVTFGDADDSDHTWSPDGRTIVFVGNRTAERDGDPRSLVYSVPAAGGQVRCLTEGNYSFESPSFSPDGTRLALLGTDDPVARRAKNDRLWTVPAGGGEPNSHTADWDRSFSDLGMSDVYVANETRPVWSPDGTAVYALAADRGTVHVHRVDLASGEVTRITDGSRRVIAFDIAGPERALIFAAGDSSHPFELVVADEQGQDERPLTEHNRAFLEEVCLSPAEEIAFRSQADDLDLQGWVIKPHGFREGVRYPLIVQIHGGPHQQYGQAMFHEMQLMAARGYVVAYSNPRGSAGYGEEFCYCTRGRWGESDAPDIHGLVDHVLSLGFVDEGRVGVTGGSYGGYLTNWLVGHSDRFKAAATQRSVVNFYSMIGTSDIGFDFGVHEFGGTPWDDAEHLMRLSPISYAKQITTPLLILHNEQDLRCPIEQAEQLYLQLKRLGREVAFVRFPDEDHNLSRTGKPGRRLARLHHLVGWFDAHL